MANLFEKTQISIKGMSCNLFLSISPSFTPGKDHTCACSIALVDIPEIILVAVTEFDAMHIPDGSIKNELDRQAALASAGALLDTDKLQEKAARVLSRLESLYMDYFSFVSEFAIRG
jgi:hypothetical protein